jgi:hypothetical protein
MAVRSVPPGPDQNPDRPFGTPTPVGPSQPGCVTHSAGVAGGQACAGAFWLVLANAPEIAASVEDRKVMVYQKAIVQSSPTLNSDRATSMGRSR